MAVIFRRVVYAVLLLGLTAALPARAQQRDTAAARRLVEQRLGRSLTHAELVERLRQSGMSRSEVRNRLQQLGLDPGLADRYFDVIERGGEPPRGEAPSDLLGALQRLGISVRAVADSLTVPDSLQLDTLLMDTLA
ncbi:MAG: hypothetical protein HY561_06280, partial [Gemmatimonadetes bacterium]|nr:hypothetical protein [Gemmatimonadota bacterium]